MNSNFVCFGGAVVVYMMLCMTSLFDAQAERCEQEGCVGKQSHRTLSVRLD